MCLLSTLVEGEFLGDQNVFEIQKTIFEKVYIFSLYCLDAFMTDVVSAVLQTLKYLQVLLLAAIIGGDATSVVGVLCKSCHLSVLFL